jgi:hypothetical protein
MLQRLPDATAQLVTVWGSAAAASVAKSYEQYGQILGRNLHSS